MVRFDKKTIAAEAGAGIGLVQTLLTKQYDRILPILPSPYNRLSSIGNILIGSTAFIVSQFTNIVENKHPDLNFFLKIYGFTTIIGGIVNGIPGPAAARMNAPTATMTGYITPTYYPDARGTFYRQPQSRAKGFASDITINPMAEIPTKIPYNKILY